VPPWLVLTMRTHHVGFVSIVECTTLLPIRTYRRLFLLYLLDNKSNVLARHSSPVRTFYDVWVGGTFLLRMLGGEFGVFVSKDLVILAEERKGKEKIEFKG
jgi:hypothetical protein